MRQLLALTIVAGCGFPRPANNSPEVDAVTPELDAGVDAKPAPRCDPTKPFDTALPLTGLATADDEQAPRLSPDELTLYFTHTTTSQPAELMVAQRASRSVPFEAPAPISQVNSTADDAFPSVTADGLTLIFDSSRSGQHVYISTRASTMAPFGAPSLAGVNSAVTTDIDFQPFITPDGNELWFATNRAGNVGDFDIIRAVRNADQTWGTPARIPELESTTADQAPIVSADGLTVYFVSYNRPGAVGGYDIWTAHRASVGAAFATPTLANVNSTGSDFVGWLSPDNCRLYFCTTRSGTWDLYIAERSPPP